MRFSRNNVNSKTTRVKVLSMRFRLLDGLEHTLEETSIEIAITHERMQNRPIQMPYCILC